MCHKSWKIGQGDGLWVIAHWAFVEGVWTHVFEGSVAYVVVDVGYLKSCRVETDDAWLYEHCELVLVKNRREGGPSIIVWHLDFRSDGHNIGADETEVDCFGDVKVGGWQFVCHENGQTCEGDSFWVIADRTFVELVSSDIKKTCCSDVVP